MLVLVEGADCPALPVKGQPIMTGGILGAYPLPAFPENINQVISPLSTASAARSISFALCRSLCG